MPRGRRGPEPRPGKPRTSSEPTTEPASGGDVRAALVERWAGFTWPEPWSVGHEVIPPEALGFVVEERRDRFVVLEAVSGTLTERELETSLRKAARMGDVRVVAGDIVRVEAGFIAEIRPRRTALLRKAAGDRDAPQILAANVGLVLVATALPSDVNPRRLVRYRTAIEASGARMITLLTKVDLVDDPAPFVELIEAELPGVPLLMVAHDARASVEAVRARLGAGTLGLLLGSSGVGKSTLVNLLLGVDAQGVGEVRARDQRGRHTTSTRTALPVPVRVGADGVAAGGGVLIDAPGLRELEPWKSEAGLREVFDDIARFAQGCRFSDCSHDTEPECAVQDAIDRGELEEERLDQFIALRAETARQGGRERRWRR